MVLCFRVQRDKESLIKKRKCGRKRQSTFCGHGMERISLTEVVRWGRVRAPLLFCCLTLLYPQTKMHLFYFLREQKHKGSSWVKQWFKVAVINERVCSDSRRSCASAPSVRLPSSTQQGCTVGMPRHDNAFSQLQRLPWASFTALCNELEAHLRQAWDTDSLG